MVKLLLSTKIIIFNFIGSHYKNLKLLLFGDVMKKTYQNLLKMAVKDVKVPNTEGFWDANASTYSLSNMTHTHEDSELIPIFMVLENLGRVYGMACIGPADGMREPISLLEYLHTESPKELILNDISSEMLREARKNLVLTGWDKKISTITTIHNPIANVDNLVSSIPDRNTTFCIGVYSADNMLDALKLYSENTNRIGCNFKLRTVIYNEKDHKLEQIDEFDFNICEYMSVIGKISLLRMTPNFYAFGIVTDKDFVSHYFDDKMLNHILASIFKTHTVKTIKNVNNDKRYITNILKSNTTYGNNYVVTTLNNVLGNIKLNEQLLSLEKINMFFS